MNLREIAKKANVSISTVSKAFKDAEDVSEETKQKIYEVAKELGCFGKYYKGRHNKKVIAVITQEMKSSFYIEYADHLRELIEKDGKIALFSFDNFDPKVQQELIEYYANNLRVDGILIFATQNHIKKGYDVPIVSIFNSTDPESDTVNTDLKTPIREAVKYLVSLGHKNIAFFGESLTLKKEAYFKDAIESLLGVEADGMVYRSESRFEQSGEELAKKILEKEDRPTAILCAYDYIAYGAINYFTKQGYSVPGDFSIIGIDDIERSQYMDIPLTSIGLDIDGICTVAWELLLKKINNPYYKMRQKIYISGNLVIRESTGRPKITK